MDFTKYEDTIFKNAMDCFKENAKEFFGLEDIEIIAPARTEMHNIKINKVYTDYIFYANNDTYLHFEFQTTNKKDDLSRFMFYDAMLYNKDNRSIKTIVVYSSNIENVETSLSCGSITYEIYPVYMKKFDGDKIYDDIKSKIENKLPLTKLDMMNLTFLPLMKSSVSNSKRAYNSVELAEKMEESNEKLQCVSMLYAFVQKFGDEMTKKKLREVFEVTEVGKMILEKGREKGREEGVEEGKTELLLAQLIKKFKNLSDEDIKKIKKLRIEKINMIAIDIFDIQSIEELRKYYN